MKRQPKLFSAIILIVILSLAAVFSQGDVRLASCLGTGSAYAANGEAGQPADSITVASFNLQIFGETKAAKPEVMRTLARIISRYDIVAVQEIRDKSDAALQKLEAMVDDLGTDYSVVVSRRLGRTSSKEQYAYFYRTDTVELLGTPYVYPEPAGTDPFQREPFIAYFKAQQGNFDVVLINLHTEPKNTPEEILALSQVLEQARSTYLYEKDFIILGDLNADCNYYRDQVNPLPGTAWLIPTGTDTTVKRTKCTYDRIIMTDPCQESFTGQAGVFRFDREYGLSYTQAVAVSDHYPVWATFFHNRDTGAAPLH
jgi:endonuclease/exonuclease/phosphatase family metal-dependent hydrolase